MSLDSYTCALMILKDALAFGIEPSLDTVTALTRRLGDPQLCYPCIQIAGTNGKTSTARFTAAFLRSQGKKVGLYTSPYLTCYNECIEIDGQTVSDDIFSQAVFEVDEAAKSGEGAFLRPTEFELLTAAAFLIFAKNSIDCAVLEVGVGGGWDATSVVCPEVAVITGIALDHCNLLGTTLGQICAHKAGIVKPGSKVVLGEGTQGSLETLMQLIDQEYHSVVFVQKKAGQLVFRDRMTAVCYEVSVSATGQGCNLIVYGTRVRHIVCAAGLPAYQAQNIACAVAAVEAMLNGALDAQALQGALKDLVIAGRFELLRESPALIVDAAHNVQSASILADELRIRYHLPKDRPKFDEAWVLIVGILREKDAVGILAEMTPLFKNVIVTQSESQRSLPCEELLKLALKVCEPGTGLSACDSISEALALAYEKGWNVVATGSITVAGEVKRILGE